MKLLSLLLVAAFMTGCSSSRADGDRVVVGPDDDVYIGQTPYGGDQSIIISERVPEAQLSGGAIRLTQGRQMVVIPARALRGSTGRAMTAEEVRARSERNAQAEEAIAKLSEQLQGLEQDMASLRRSMTVESVHGPKPVASETEPQVAPTEHDAP